MQPASSEKAVHPEFHPSSSSGHLGPAAVLHSDSESDVQPITLTASEGDGRVSRASQTRVRTAHYEAETVLWLCENPNFTRVPDSDGECDPHWT